MLKINTCAGSLPRDLLDQAARELISQVTTTASMYSPGPDLREAVVRARVAQARDDADDLVRALRDVAHAAIARNTIGRAHTLPPRNLLDNAMRAVIGQVTIAASMSERPPQLQPSLVRAGMAHDLHDVEDEEEALRDVAHAAIASIVRVRAAEEG